MHIPSILAELVQIVRFGPNWDFNDLATSLPGATLKSWPGIEIGFIIEFDGGDHIGMKESMNTLFGNVKAMNCNANGQIRDQARARRIFDEVLEHMTAPASV